MKKKKLSTEEKLFLRKVTGYSALAGVTLLLSPTVSKGEIIYTDPADITVNFSNNDYYMDVDGDGNNDFKFKHDATGPRSSEQTLGVIALSFNENSVRFNTSTNYVSKLDSNVTMPTTATYPQNWETNVNMGFIYLTSTSSIISSKGNWTPGVSEKFIGIVFYISDSETYHYGWVRASTSLVDGWDYTLTIHDWAYEDEVGIQIKTGEGDTPLPVELADFALVQENASVRLNWQTASETENSGFIIQRKCGEGIWEKLADHLSDQTLVGHGTSSETNDYSWLDENVEPGSTYQYRLGDIDHANTIVWHDIREITITEEAANMPGEFGLQSAFPNPFNPTLTIRYGLTEDAQTSVKILDLQGKTISTLSNKHQKAGSYELQWQAGDNASGVYLVEVVSGDRKDMKKVLLTK